MSTVVDSLLLVVVKKSLRNVMVQCFQPPSPWNSQTSLNSPTLKHVRSFLPQGTWTPLNPSQPPLSVSFLRWCGHPPAGWAVPSTPVAASASGAALGARRCTWSATTLLSKCSIGREGLRGRKVDPEVELAEFKEKEDTWDTLPSSILSTLNARCFGSFRVH